MSRKHCIKCSGKGNISVTMSIPCIICNGGTPGCIFCHSQGTLTQNKIIKCPVCHGDGTMYVAKL